MPTLTNREIREQFDAEHSTPENPPVKENNAIYYHDGSIAEVGHGMIVTMPANNCPSSHPMDIRNHGIRCKWNIAHYWELRTKLAQREFHNTKAEAKNQGCLYREVEIPGAPMKFNGKPLFYPGGNPRLHPSTKSKQALSPEDTLKVIKKLRKAVHYCQKQWMQAQQATQPPAPEPTSHDPAKEEFQRELRAINI